MNRQIFQGDVLEQLAQFPDECIDTIISSPPYYSLRNYLVEGQLGLEPDFHDYLNKMQTIMDELRRVLKNTGTCWINLGDTYGGGVPHSDWEKVEKRFQSKSMRERKFQVNQPKPMPKSRIGIPERFYINCIDSGWIARNHIIWTKNNPMPSSVKDRFTNKWESVFFFAKNRKYYFDLDAVREPTITPTKPFNARVRDSKKQRYLQGATDEEIKNHNGKGEFKGKASKEFLLKWQKNEDSIHGNNAYNPKGKNPGDIFRINTKPFKEAHFATFPPALPEKILKCSCPNQVCNKCGKPREVITNHIVEHFRENNRVDKNTVYDKHSHVERLPSNWKPKEKDEIIGYTDCGCNAGFKPGIVLDPFFGSGTVGLVAEQLGLQWCGIELNPEYIEIAKKRLAPYTSLEKLENFT